MNEKIKFRLEILKIILSILVPILLGLLAWNVQKTLSESKLKARSYIEQQATLSRLRIEIFGQIREPLNNIFSYIEEVGGWEEFTAEEIKSQRRQLNKIMYSNKNVWSDCTFEKYIAYIDVIAFDSSMKGCTKINAEKNDTRLQSKSWSDKDEILLTGIKNPEHRLRFENLMQSVAYDTFFSNN